MQYAVERTMLLPCSAGTTDLMLTTVLMQVFCVVLELGLITFAVSKCWITWIALLKWRSQSLE